MNKLHTISAITTALVLIAAAIFWVWLQAGIVRSQWAIELVGGNEALSSMQPTPTEDFIFLRSLDPTLNSMQTIEALENAISRAKACLTTTPQCININLAIANGFASTQKDFSIAKWFLETYSKASTEICPINTELSTLVYETNLLMAKPETGRATHLLLKIKKDGGINNKIATPECKKYLQSHSQIAKAYLFYLSTLMSMTDYSPNSTWIYLLHKSKYKI